VRIGGRPLYPKGGAAPNPLQEKATGGHNISLLPATAISEPKQGGTAERQTQTPHNPPAQEGNLHNPTRSASREDSTQQAPKERGGVSHARGRDESNHKRARPKEAARTRETAPRQTPAQSSAHTALDAETADKRRGAAPTRRTGSDLKGKRSDPTRSSARQPRERPRVRARERRASER